MMGDPSILKGPYAAVKEGRDYIAIMVAPGHENSVFMEEDDLIALAMTVPVSRRNGGPVALVPGKIYAVFKICSEHFHPLRSAV